jgi:hypothetical protein
LFVLLLGLSAALRVVGRVLSWTSTSFKSTITSDNHITLISFQEGEEAFVKGFGF